MPFIPFLWLSMVCLSLCSFVLVLFSMAGALPADLQGVNLCFDDESGGFDTEYEVDFLLSQVPNPDEFLNCFSSPFDFSVTSTTSVVASSDLSTTLTISSELSDPSTSTKAGSDPSTSAKASSDLSTGLVMSSELSNLSTSTKVCSDLSTSMKASSNPCISTVGSSNPSTSAKVSSNPSTSTNASSDSSLGSSRFKNVSESDYRNTEKARISPNTVKATNLSVNVWTAWSEHRRRINVYNSPPHIFILATNPWDFNRWLCRFVLEVRRKDGKEYPPNTLHQLCCGVLCYARERVPEIDIFKQPAFKQFQNILD